MNVLAALCCNFMSKFVTTDLVLSVDPEAGERPVAESLSVGNPVLHWSPSLHQLLRVHQD